MQYSMTYVVVQILTPQSRARLKCSHRSCGYSAVTCQKKALIHFTGHVLLNKGKDSLVNESKGNNYRDNREKREKIAIST